jgi:hypothetical protein
MSPVSPASTRPKRPGRGRTANRKRSDSAIADRPQSNIVITGYPEPHPGSCDVSARRHRRRLVSAGVGVGSDARLHDIGQSSPSSSLSQASPVVAVRIGRSGWQEASCRHRHVCRCRRRGRRRPTASPSAGLIRIDDKTALVAESGRLLSSSYRGVALVVAAVVGLRRVGDSGSCRMRPTPSPSGQAAGRLYVHVETSYRLRIHQPSFKYPSPFNRNQLFL